MKHKSYYLLVVVCLLFASVIWAMPKEINIHNIGFSEIAHDQFKVHWKVKDKDGTKYMVRVTDKNNVIVRKKAAKKYLLITDLDQETKYWVKIRGINHKVKGKWSAAKGITTPSREPVETTVLFGGDVMLSRYVGRVTEASGDWTLPFVDIADEFSQNDLVFVNLEAPFKETGPYYVSDDAMTFKVNPEMMAGLKLADINVASLANNHIYNAGSSSVDYTKSYLNENNIEYCFDVPAIQEVNDLKFGFLCYSYDLNLDTNLLISQINEIKDQTDFIVVSMHNGSEYTESISSSQSNFAHTAIDNGADLVIGHHPHVVQHMEEYNGKYIFYSLGNLVFDQSWSWPTQLGATVKMTWEDKELKKIEFKPIKIDDDFQPRFMDFEEGLEVLGRLQVDNYEIIK
jgi:poly-gamma-glutamate synthesis protein (capsule biosynthesis protein)